MRYPKLSVIVILALLLSIYPIFFKAEALTIKSEGIFLSKQEVIDLEKKIKKLKALLKKAEEERDAYKEALQEERHLSELEIKKLKELLALKEEEIKILREILDNYKSYARDLEKVLRHAERKNVLKQILLFLAGIAVGKAF